MVWKKIFGTRSGSGATSVYFSSDGGVIVGGYKDATGAIGDMNFKSSGIINTGKPTADKISAANVAATTVPTTLVWSWEETDTSYIGITKSMRLDSSDNIYLNVGLKSQVIKLNNAGAKQWGTAEIDATVQTNDIELIGGSSSSDPVTGIILVGHQFATTTTGCIGTGCSVIKGAMIEISAST